MVLFIDFLLNPVNGPKEPRK